MALEARVVNIDGSEFVPHVITGNPKFRKDGGIKQVADNRAVGVSTATDPMTKEEWQYGLIYLQKKVVEKAGKPKHQKQAAMWVLYWKVSMLCGGFRVEDCLNIKWSDIFEKDGKTFRKNRGKVEQKTDKVKFFYRTPELISAINEYVDTYNVDTIGDGYIFTNQSGKQLTRQAVWQKVKEVTSALGLDGHYGSHSLRKTFAMTTMNRLDQTTNMTETEVRNFVQASLNHRDNGTTLRYLGIKRKNEEEQAIAHAAWIMSDSKKTEDDYHADKIVEVFKTLPKTIQNEVIEKLINLM